MSRELLNSWASVSLDALGTWFGGGTPSKSNPAYWHKGTIHWVSPKDMKRLFIDSAQDQITKKAVKESATNLIPANSVLMVTRSGILAHTFPVGINTIDVAINQDLKAWTPCGAVDPVYVAYFLKSRSQNILRTCSKDGTTVSSIEFDRLSAYSVAVAPANEQRRIVSKIDELFSRIEEGEQALKRVEKLVERYRQSVLKAAATGELTRDWREARKRAGEPVESGEALLARILKARRTTWEAAELAKLKARGKAPTDDRWKQKYKDPEPPDTTDLPELPKGWIWASAEQIFGFITKGTTPPKSFAANGQQAVPFLRVTNLTHDGSLNFSDRAFVSMGVHNGILARSKVFPGDLVMNIVGPPLGQVSLITDEFREWNANQAIAIFHALPDVQMQYFTDYLLSSVAQDWLERRAKATAGQVNLTLDLCRRLPVALPPFEEQRAIVSTVNSKMDAARRTAKGCAEERARSTALRQSVLKAAFSGQLVPQDPNDEPASMLLERIAAERAEGVPVTRKRKKKIA